LIDMPAHRVTRIVRVLKLAVLLQVFVALAARSQQTNAVRVILNGCHLHSDLASIEMVLNGDERATVQLGSANASKDVWTGEWHNPNDRHLQFAAAGSYASLRLQDGRTDCRRSIAERHDDRIEAVFTFECDENPSWNVTIQTEPEMNFSYVRVLKASRTKALDCDCRESGGKVGRGTIYVVRLPREVLNLQPGLEDAFPNVLWMRLNELAVIKNPTRGAFEALNYDRVVETIVRSTRGEEFSSNAYDIKPWIKGLTKLTVTVN
jgi:hypothetical protein